MQNEKPVLTELEYVALAESIDNTSVIMML